MKSDETWCCYFFILTESDGALLESSLTYMDIITSVAYFIQNIPTSINVDIVGISTDGTYCILTEVVKMTKFSSNAENCIERMLQLAQT